MKNSLMRSAITSDRKFRKAGLIILGVFFCTAVFSPVIAPYSPFERTGEPFEPPGKEHILGCNDVGNDLFSEIVYGARISLFVGLIVAFSTTIIAVTAALLSGYLRGWVDVVIMRIVDIVMALPFLPLVLVLGVFIGPGIGTQILIISLIMWAHPSRELRSQVFSVRESGYVEAARSMGGHPFTIMYRHVLPEILPLIVPQFIRIAQSAILIESSLSFLGLGDPIQKSWGSILFYANSRAAFLTGAWTYWVLPPGICIALTVIGFSLTGFSLGGRSGLKYCPFGSFLLERKKKSNKTNVINERLKIDDLTVLYKSRYEEIAAVEKADFTIGKDEFTGLVGESGSGKSTLAFSALGLLKYPAHITSGEVLYKDFDLLELSSDLMRELRGKRISYVPQNSMNALNPVMTVKKQIMESILVHGNIKKSDAGKKAAELLELVGLPGERADSFPHELSGGMKQRVVIAAALANEPELLIADEPTSGLDILTQKEIIDLLVQLKEKFKMSLFFITHDLPLVTGIADNLSIMYRGKIVDRGSASRLRLHPGHFHTKDLFDSLPALHKAKTWDRRNVKDLSGKNGHSGTISDAGNVYGAKPLLQISNVSRTFYSFRNLLTRDRHQIKAVNSVFCTIDAGEVVGLIGGSGSGKTTIARLVMGLIKTDSGEIFFNGENISSLHGSRQRKILGKISMIFQDPYQSVRSGMKIRDVIAEPLKNQGVKDRKILEYRVNEALESVNLSGTAAFSNRCANELSGGERQRVAFARAIVTSPLLIIADEPTSLLDVSLRMEILELMESIRRKNNAGFLYITHNIALARHFCDRLIVMQDGKIVEDGPAESVVAKPVHEYTKKLIEAVKEYHS